MLENNEQFAVNDELDSGANTNVFDILIETIGSENVETEHTMDDSFALLSDFLSMHAAKNG